MSNRGASLLVSLSLIGFLGKAEVKTCGWLVCFCAISGSRSESWNLDATVLDVQWHFRGASGESICNLALPGLHSPWWPPLQAY